MNELIEQKKLPNATGVLILGILSIPMCCCTYGLVGLAIGIVALFLYSKDYKLYAANPEAYVPSSYSNLKAGRICAIIGIIFSLLMVLFAVWFLAQYGWEALTDEEEMRRILESMQR